MRDGGPTVVQSSSHMCVINHNWVVQCLGPIPPLVQACVRCPRIVLDVLVQMGKNPYC